MQDMIPNIRIGFFAVAETYGNASSTFDAERQFA